MGDFRFLHGERSAHHLSADLAQLRCAFGKAEPSEWRVVLDSVLFSIALLRGGEALHAGAVATEKGAIAIAAASGGGKSSLLAALLQAGLPLLSDDVVVLDADPGRLSRASGSAGDDRAHEHCTAAGRVDRNALVRRAGLGCRPIPSRFRWRP